MLSIFISYRRDDSEGHAGRLYDDLVRRFGEGSVFMDVAGIEPGVDFRKAIDKYVGSCGVLLTLIGPGWLNAKSETGQRRLDDPLDLVRLETASALKRGIPVVPVLVHGARMPRAEELPGDLADLSYRNGLELSHSRWDADVAILVKAVQRHVEAPEQEPRRPQPLVTSERIETLLPTPVIPSKPPNPLRRMLVGAVVGAIVCAVGVAVVLDLRSKPAVITSFVATPSEIAEGGTVTLQWAVTNADTVELKPYGDVTASGSTIDRPKSTIIYTLEAKKHGGKSAVTAIQQVIVDKPPRTKGDNRPTESPSQADSTEQAQPGLPATVPEPSSPDFAGTWAEIRPEDSARPMRLKIEQSGNEIQLYLSYTQSFSNKPFFQAPIKNGRAIATMPQGCAKIFQHAGYKYDDPSVNIFSVSLRNSVLIYEQSTQWTSPCDGHPIGVERNERQLQRVSQ